MFQCHAKSILTTLLIITGINGYAQTNGSGSNPQNGKENNPYSKYGIGELANGNNAAMRGMGNITSACLNPYQLNTDNPASYSFLQRTTFELGAYGSNRNIHGTINGADQSYRTGTVSVSYLTLGVPINKNGGFVFGFKPFSHTYYSLVDTVAATATSPYLIKNYNGEGSLHNAYLGGSAKYKGLSVGFNIGYLFGSMRNTAALYPDRYTSSGIFNSEYSSYTRVGGVQWKGGLLYEKKIDSTHSIRLGGTITLGQQVKQHYSEYHISSYIFSDTITRDTSYQVNNQTGTIDLPLSYSVGAMFVRNGKWAAGVDYTATDWSTFKSDLNPNMNLGVGSSSYKMSIGGEYTPDAFNLKHYLSRITYRLGAYYGNDYLKVNNTVIPFYGITAGFSMPFRRSLSQVHAAIDAGVLGTSESNLMKQNYVRITLGISLNDLWFVKRKYE